MQKKAIRLLIGLPRISHTSEAFWALNILPFSILGVFNVLKFLIQFKTGQLSPSFKKDFFTFKDINRLNLRNKEDFVIPRVKSEKIGRLPPHNFPKIWCNNKKSFPDAGPFDSLSKLRENLLNNYYERNQCRSSKTCFVCKRLTETKNEFIKLKLKRLKRVEAIIKHRGQQKTCRIKKVLRFSPRTW